MFVNEFAGYYGSSPSYGATQRSFKGKRLSDSVRRQILVEVENGGKSLRQIAREFNICHKSVMNILKARDRQLYGSNPEPY